MLNFPLLGLGNAERVVDDSSSIKTSLHDLITCNPGEILLQLLALVTVTLYVAALLAV